MKFYVIGISDSPEPHFSSEIQNIVASHTVFSGGARHREIVAGLLPDGYAWIEIAPPLNDVFQQYESHDEIVVFASGDPLFYGFACTIRRLKPDAEIVSFPHFNSLQLLAHRISMPYRDMRAVSLTGRDWAKFDESLIAACETIGILTDSKEHTPSAIAARMLDYGYNNYTMTVGERLGNRALERTHTCTPEEAVGQSFAFPNCLILQRTRIRPRPFGIPESEFHLLDGRAKMITKMPVRLVLLGMLALRDKSVFWDIGFCTGSVSIEARLQFPHLQIFAFERRAEAERLMNMNARKFGTPGISVLIGDFTQADISELPSPDAVFIGGHGGKLSEIVAIVANALNDNGAIVFNSVSDKSARLFEAATAASELNPERSIRLKADDFNSVLIMKATKRI
ncbi:MAG: precorrin-6y C5,15-methyltransferase (decarboxylating) subunit CbiE [Prevotellaceae bacterium]|jgi:precorrin-6Y C5,15-methyltransferase (decarboxylating)|nr:precorrin-6y C5,15-methyltransferase (decarboxylating) subunit CbiE [Prevotellaceae bacterium]